MTESNQTKKLYELLEDGELKDSNDIAPFFGILPKSVPKFMRRVKKKGKLNWLGSVKYDGRLHWFRDDLITPEKREFLKNMGEESIPERIRLAIQEPRTIKEIVEETGLTYKVVRKNLEKTGMALKEKVSLNRYASLNPSVYYTKTEDELRALFKSASGTYGERLYEYFSSVLPITTRDNISHGLNIDKETLDSLLKRLRNYGLVKNVPYVCWFTPSIVSEEIIKKIFSEEVNLKGKRKRFQDIQKLFDLYPIYLTLKGGIEGFKRVPGMLAVSPSEKTAKFMSSTNLQNVANSQKLLVIHEGQMYYPKLGETLFENFTFYKEISKRYAMLERYLISSNQ